MLVVTLADMGDALLTAPALQALRAHVPAARIDVLTTPLGAAALRHRAPFDRAIVLEKARFGALAGLASPAVLSYTFRLWRRLRTARYDACVLLRHLTTAAGALKHAAIVLASGAPRRFGLDNGRGWFLTDRVRDEGFGTWHEATYWLEVAALLGAPPAPAAVLDPVPAPAREEARRLLQSLPRGDGPVVALSPGSGAFAPARRWPVERFALLAGALLADRAQLVLVGGAEEAPLRRALLAALPDRAAVDLGGRTSVDVLAGVLEACDMFVGNDSGVAHLAAAVGTPVTAVFGPTDPRAWGPYGGEEWRVVERAPGLELLASGPHRALWAPIACSPCIYRGHRLGTPLGCPDRTCLERIDSARVAALVRRRLRELEEQRCGSTT